MWTLLFDIDGTLLRTQGAGATAIRRSLKIMFDIDDVPEVEYAGRTDRAIIGDLFQPFKIDVEQNLAPFNQLYWEQLPQSLAELNGEVLPGVRQLLKQLALRTDVALGLLTGNSERAAMLKLAHFELDHYFHFGGYGDQYSDRNDVASAAISAARNRLQTSLNREKVWVIGDTVNDIRCARSIQSRVVAVETGSCDSSDLTAAKPEIQFSSLADSNQFLDEVLHLNWLRDGAAFNRF